MSGKTTAVGVAGVVLAAACILGAVMGNGGFGPRPGTVVDETGDCDAGDLREKTPDPDCHGLWLGTPTPGAKPKTPAAKPKTPAPRRTR